MAKVTWIGIRPERKAPLEVLEAVEVNAFGLEGDHYSKEYGKRNVTMIKQEVIADVWSEMGLEGTPDPGQMRRNIVVEGLPVGSYEEATMQIGENVVLKVTGDCRPCSRMNQNLGEGGLSKMSGNGGFTLQVEQGGVIKVGDQVELKGLLPVKEKRYLP